jgi:hypothetical protein
MTLIIDPNTKERVYELRCHCEEKGGEVRFTEAQVAMHGGDAALESELDAIYVHRCNAHART